MISMLVLVDAIWTIVYYSDCWCLAAETAYTWMVGEEKKCKQLYWTLTSLHLKQQQKTLECEIFFSLCLVYGQYD